MVRTNERNAAKIKRCLKIATLVDLCCDCCLGKWKSRSKSVPKVLLIELSDCWMSIGVCSYGNCWFRRWISAELYAVGWCDFLCSLCILGFYIVHTQMEWGCFCFSIRNCSINQGNSTHDFFSLSSVSFYFFFFFLFFRYFDSQSIIVHIHKMYQLTDFMIKKNCTNVMKLFIVRCCCCFFFWLVKNESP